MKCRITSASSWQGFRHVNFVGDTQMTYAQKLATRFNRRAACLMSAAALVLAGQQCEAQALLSSGGSASVPVSSITVAEFAAGRVFQRDKGTYSSFNDGTKAVRFTGTYTGGTPLTITAAVKGVAYPCTIISAANGIWAAAATIPNGDDYTATISCSPGTATASQSNRWGVGILIALFGDSIMQQMWYTTAGAAIGDAHARWTVGTGWWLTSQTGKGERSADNGLNHLATAIRSHFMAASRGNTTPVGFIAGAISSTTSTDWQTGHSAWTSWTNLIANSDIGGDYEMVLCNIGATDTDIDQTPGSSPTFATKYANIYKQVQSQTGRNTSQVKLGSALTGVLTGSGTSDANCDFVRTGEKEQALGAGCFWLGSNTDHTHGLDGIHYSAELYERLARRYAVAVCKQLGILTFGSDGPKISSANWSVGTNQLVANITHLSCGTALLDGSGSRTGTGLVGFVIKVNESTVTPASTAFSGNMIVFTMPKDRPMEDKITICYCGGANPWGWTNRGDSIAHLVFDNCASYVGDSVGFPLQPTPGGLASPMTVT